MDYALKELIQQVMTARATQQPLIIRGGGTKDFYGERYTRETQAKPAVLDMASYRGIVSYQPSELVITARAGTSLTDIEQALDEHDQALSFEPPRLGTHSTLGGCVASGLSGPRRMAVGSLRDFVLGSTLLDSSGTMMRFGGEVMKNVAGYDVSRLLAGSLGILGPLLEISVKVAPKPQQEITLVLEMSQAQALDSFNRWRSMPLPISASVWCEGTESGTGLLHLRLAGSLPAVEQASAALGGQRISAACATDFWTSVRDQSHAFFQQRPLWRVAVPPATPPLNLGSNCFIEWNGGLRWLTGIAQPLELRAAVAALGGHATLYRYAGAAPDYPIFHPVSPALKTIHWRLKQAFDPIGIFNPRRLFPDY